MKQIIFVLIVALVIGMIALTTSAQEEMPSCEEVFVAYGNFMENEPSGLVAVAQLAQWRRQLEQQDTHPCDDVPYEALIDALNLTADSLLSAHLGSSDAGDLLALANTRRDIAAETLVIPPVSPTPLGLIAIIESPTNGEVVPFNIQAQGSANTEMLGENKLWLMVFVSNKYYPQAQDGCSDQRESLPISRRNDRWQMPMGLGQEGSVDKGKEFELGVVVVDTEGHAKLNEYFDQWCANQSWTGLSETQLYDEIGAEDASEWIAVTRS